MTSKLNLVLNKTLSLLAAQGCSFEELTEAYQEFEKENSGKIKKLKLTKAEFIKEEKQRVKDQTEAEEKELNELNEANYFGFSTVEAYKNWLGSDNFKQWRKTDDGKIHIDRIEIVEIGEEDEEEELNPETDIPLDTPNENPETDETKNNE